MRTATRGDRHDAARTAASPPDLPDARLFVVGTVASAIVVNLVPDTVPPSTASDFFFAASGVNATLLVAIAVTISSIVRGRWRGPTSWRTALFIAPLSVVFVGMIAGGLGILLFHADVPFEAGRSGSSPTSCS